MIGLKSEMPEEVTFGRRNHHLFKINGRRERGRPRTMWMDNNIKEWTKYHIMTVLEWHKIENDGDPRQPTS